MSRKALENFDLMVLLAVLRVGEDTYDVPIVEELFEEATIKPRDLEGIPLGLSSVYMDRTVK